MCTGIKDLSFVSLAIEFKLFKLKDLNLHSYITIRRTTTQIASSMFAAFLFIHAGDIGNIRHVMNMFWTCPRLSTSKLVCPALAWNMSKTCQRRGSTFAYVPVCITVYTTTLFYLFLQQKKDQPPPKKEPVVIKKDDLKTGVSMKSISVTSRKVTGDGYTWAGFSKAKHLSEFSPDYFASFEWLLLTHMWPQTSLADVTW